MGDTVKIQELDPTTQERLKDLFNVPDQADFFARYGDAGYTLAALYKGDANHIRNIIRNKKKKYMAVRPDDVWITKFPGSEKSGGWREHFDDDMAAQAQHWMRENLADSDLCFPLA